MQRKGIVIRRRVLMMVTRHGLHNECHEPSKESREQERPNGPHEYLAANNDASQIHVLLLLLLAGTKEPALLSLVEGPRQRRPVDVLQVAAAVVVGGGVGGVDLQRPTPRVPSVHTDLEKPPPTL